LRPDWTAGRRSAGKRTQSSRRSMGHRRGHELHRSWSGSSECKAGCAPTRRRPRRRPPAQSLMSMQPSTAPVQHQRRHGSVTAPSEIVYYENSCAISVPGTTAQLRVSCNNFFVLLLDSRLGAVGSWCPKQAPLQPRILGSWGSSENTEDCPEAVSKRTLFETLRSWQLSTLS
jgi:hypothetical protein